MKEIFTRRSIRNYNLEKKLTKEELIDIINAGFQAPSARNQQALSFLIIDDMSIIEKIGSKIVKSSLKITDCNTYICVLGNKNAPIYDMLVVDAAASVMNMMTYARSKNLGTCWVGLYGSRERTNDIVEVLDIPSIYTPLCLMAIGYPKVINDFKEVDRFDLNKIFYNEVK